MEQATHFIPPKLNVKTRVKKFYLVMLFLLSAYLLADYFMGMKMILLNYAVLPVTLGFILHHLFKRNLGVSIKHKEEFLKKLDNKLQSLPFIKILKIADIASTFSIVNSILRLTLLLILIAVVMAWLPASFISVTLNSSNIALNSAVLPDFNFLEFNTSLIKIVEHYLQQLYLMNPWFLIVGYVAFYAALVNKFNIVDMRMFIHQAHKTSKQDDTWHNIVRLLHSMPYFLMICLLFAMATYGSYLYLAAVLHLVPLQGVTNFNLMFAIITVVIITRKHSREVLRYFEFHQWSGLKLCAVVAAVLLIALLTITLVVNYLTSSHGLLLLGPYNLGLNDIKLQFLFLVWGLSWFTAPLIAYKIHHSLNNYSVNKQIMICFSAMTLCYTLLNSSGINSLLSQVLIKILSLPLINWMLLVLMSLALLKEMFKDKNNVTMDILDQASQLKTRPPATVLHMLFVVLALLLFCIILENVYIIYKIVAFLSIINTLLFIYFIVSYYRLKI